MGIGTLRRRQAGSIGRAVVAVVVVTERIAGDAIAFRCPIAEIDDAAALRAERPVWVAFPDNRLPASRTAMRFHGAADDSAPPAWGEAGARIAMLACAAMRRSFHRRGRKGRKGTA